MNTVLPTSPQVRDDGEDYRTILGVKFFVGDAPSAIRRLSAGGLLVVPAAPALKNLPHDVAYREALLGADIAITDSIFMVILWNLFERDSIRRLSGLEYLRVLLKMPEIRAPHGTYWIMANPDSAQKNMDWLNAQGVHVTQDDVYLAPFYGSRIDDQDLLARLSARMPRHIIVTIGGGNQERLGLYLKQNLGYKPAIHCIGAAIAFLSGDQVHIPNWADRWGLGWLLRSASRPRLYVPRYWDARKLLPLMLRYRHRLPVD
jgi:UDP-N-acetyl-D-mannosaminuronic acid transferase (WecB/TagA/CpsF family)